VKSMVWIGVFLLCSVLGAQTPAPPAPPVQSTPQAPATPPEQQPAPQTQPPAIPAAAPAEVLENMTSFALYNWRTSGGMSLLGGTNSTNAADQTLKLPNNPIQANGATLTLRAYGPTRLEVSYFDVRNTGNVIGPGNLSLFGLTVSPGDYLVVDYRIRNAKVTWNYLTFPVPALDSKLRIKTLWEVQYTVIRSYISSPTTASFPAAKQEKIIYPTFGLGVEYVASKRFRMEARFSGFALPSHSVIWDGEGSFVGRFGHLEVFGGMKGYHFRTGTATDIYMQGTLWGPNAGLRWVFR
jgi:hypothetical protein